MQHLDSLRPLRIRDIARDLCVHTVLAFPDDDGIAISLLTVAGTVNFKLTEHLALELGDGLRELARPQGTARRPAPPHPRLTRKQAELIRMVDYCVAHRDQLSPRTARWLSEHMIGRTRFNRMQAERLRDAYGFLQQQPGG